MDVGENTSLGDGGAVKKLVQLLVVADGQLDVAGDNAGLLVVTSGVSGQLENLSGQVLDDGGEGRRGSQLRCGQRSVPSSSVTRSGECVQRGTADRPSWNGIERRISFRRERHFSLGEEGE